MDTQHPSVPSHAPSALADTPPGALPEQRERHPYGVTHANTRHTTRFTVIGNHLAQHSELSLLAIGLSVHIQSLPTGARVDIKTLAARFPEGADRISGALRELEAHGYLRRVRERVPGGRIVTRTVSCNQPAADRHPHPSKPADRRPPDRPCPPGPARTAVPAPSSARLAPRRKPAPLHVPQPASPAPSLLQSATDLLAGLHHQDPRLLLSARDADRLAPGVAAWLERDVSPAAVRHALTSDLPPDGVRLLAHRLTVRLPSPPPFRARAQQHPLQNCDSCDRAFRSPEPGDCRPCLAAARRKPD
ncbi:helix-turn-helix domain-containing protein [Streptomyces sp. NPDC019890]|uniref:helix-turn-helix domain-containing protein n=1 Tax=Streptomyces sp. NPDC019890 TaxID=3365064 RepID=UPI00384B59AC